MVRELIARPVTYGLAYVDMVITAVVIVGVSLAGSVSLGPAVGDVVGVAVTFPVAYVAAYATLRLTTETLPGRRRPLVAVTGELADRVAAWAGWELIDPDEAGNEGEW